MLYATLLELVATVLVLLALIVSCAALWDPRPPRAPRP